MNLIKLDAIDSTNRYLKELSSEKDMEDYTIVVADFQTDGRGQMGANWVSESGKNLMFSLFKQIGFLNNEENFYVSIIASLAVFKALQQMNIPDLKIKWPNDILSGNCKICGILVETIIKKNKIKAVIIGIGLNVSQTDFENVPNASSLLNITGTVYDKEEILFKISEYFRSYESMLLNKKFNRLKEEYEQHLFRKDKPSTFKDKSEGLFMGFIKGISGQGLLQVLLEDNILQEFDLKEIKLLY
ncbi:biotin--[acetyl-CoA-carboxylase] ligase [Abyssalbus ytuae]|uniref:Biotin--[acetyl-CoA-carboxylase] ligase n=1 Tax=Abyssalbus ytuae TaxID=2926907 RepID=A0A9E6ZXJ7_9FLAO|nr:biotin--[acetyl-CoA-carboxylase] ligase [Abyssalbus ytuae]UOB17002.1 biotin--[acetyl-CoA-carboxylase] ligase [Abyssalbus ytuae]